MKKAMLILITIAIICFVWEFLLKKEISEIDNKSSWDNGETVVVQPTFDVVYKDITYSYDKNNLSIKCEEHEAICAVDLMVKCTINPKMEICDADKLPKFIFMEDESLGRPSKQTFKIEKIKPIDADTIEIHTIGTCDGQWFGLCAGKIIYIVDKEKGFWRVKDVYALSDI